MPDEAVEIDVAKAVAKMECPCRNGICLCYIDMEDDHGCSCMSVMETTCITCQGTGLSWPTLSRECPRNHTHTVRSCYSMNDNPRPVSCEQVGCSGRIPDVTTDKVHLIFWEMGCSRFFYEPEVVTLFFPHKLEVIGHGKTDLKAACAALLATIQ